MKLPNHVLHPIEKYRTAHPKVTIVLALFLDPQNKSIWARIQQKKVYLLKSRCISMLGFEPSFCDFLDFVVRLMAMTHPSHFGHPEDTTTIAPPSRTEISTPSMG